MSTNIPISTAPGAGPTTGTGSTSLGATTNAPGEGSTGVSTGLGVSGMGPTGMTGPDYHGGYDYGGREMAQGATQGFGFGPSFTEVGLASGRTWRPRTDILEVGEQVRVEFELPGVNTEDVSLSLNENILVLQTTKFKNKKDYEGNYFIRERHFGDFYRKIVLPDYVDTGKVDALLENGVLKVVMRMKTEPSNQANMIYIRPHAK